jgi:predicted enzyme related to lactoylglutathione lyase
VVSRIAQWTLDVQDVEVMARFWSAALGYRMVPDEGSESVHLHPPAEAGPRAPTVWLQACAGPKTGKNRNHPDLACQGDAEAEADRLVALGAKRIDVGQPDDAGFIVLADPEGNEFCILRERAW